MMKPRIKSIKLKTKGFLLAEAVFSVFVTLLVVLTMQSLLKSISLAQAREHRTNDVVFAYVQLNHFLRDQNTRAAYVNLKTSNHYRAVVNKISDTGEEKTYVLMQYRNMIRVTTSEGGHMPLLIGVKKAIFSTQDQQLKIALTETDNCRSELIFKLDPKPTKKEKTSANKKSKSQGKRLAK